MFKNCLFLLVAFICMFLFSAIYHVHGSSLTNTIIQDPLTTIKQTLQLESNLLHQDDHNSSKRYEIAKFDFERVSTPYIICLWIVIVGVAKIGFHVTPKLPSVCPESVVLMILGAIIGLIFYYGGISSLHPLTPELFFFYMLPPIVMDAGFHMPNRLFFDNLSSILLYAVVGTVWNAVTIGLALYWLAQTGIFGKDLPILDTFLFSSIVSAVDPVAVLAVFEEIHVNEVLYILVFGESLLNDGVTVVLYKMFEGYAEMGAENLLPIDYSAGIASFFFISLGGTFIGIFWGLVAAFVSRFTHHVKIIEPIFVFVFSYLAYLTAEMFHLSGILALTFSGITMKNYVIENVSQTSQTTLKYAMKMLANASESVIFLFLGFCTVGDTHDWNTMFVVCTIFFCLIFRSLGVVLFTSIANRFRLHKLSAIEQFIMAYGGLRGAVAFALVLVVDERIVHAKRMMVTTVIALVYFTVFLQGMTVGSLVKILRVPRSNKFEMTMNERIHSRLMDHLMAGIEDISGMMVGNYKIRDKFRHFDNKYLKHWLLRDSHGRGYSSRKIFETVSRLNLQDAINLVKYNPSVYLNNNNNVSTDKSLSSLFRSYTQTSFTQSDDGLKRFSSLPMDSINMSSFNFDVGNIEYNPSTKDLDAFEMHHILSDNMFKPIKKYRRYSRTDLQLEPTTGYQHQSKTDTRHTASASRRKSKRHKSSSSSKSNSSPKSNNLLRVSGISDNDEGIVFTVTSPYEDSKTLTETMLPWRRKSLVEGNDQGRSKGPLKQDEFPSWIENKDYIPSYASPTNTLLRRIDTPNNKPRIYEIFTINESSPNLSQLVQQDNDYDEEGQSTARVNMAFLNDEPHSSNQGANKDPDSGPKSLTVYRL